MLRTYNPNWRKQQAYLHPGEVRIDSGDNDCPVELGADPDADDAEVHQR